MDVLVTGSLSIWAGRMSLFCGFCTSVFFMLCLVKFLLKGRLVFHNIFLVKLPNICIHLRWLKQIMIWTMTPGNLSVTAQTRKQYFPWVPKCTTVKHGFPQNSWQAQTRKLKSRKLLIKEHKSQLKTVLNRKYRIKGTGHRLFYFRHEGEIVCCTRCCLSKLV